MANIDPRWEAMAKAFQENPVQVINEQEKEDAEAKAYAWSVMTERNRAAIEANNKYAEAHTCKSCGAPTDDDGKYDEPWPNTGW